MSFIRKVNNSIQKRCERLFFHSLTRISPELNTRVNFKMRFGCSIDLKNPKTFNEKISWLKLYAYSNSEQAIMCSDKYLVRKYVEECGCSEILNDLYYSWDDPEEINWSELPSSFVLKWNFGMGANIICTDKSKLNEHEVKRQLAKWRKNNFWLNFAEMHYSRIQPKIICEKYLNDGTGKLPVYYKVYCFNGIPKFVCVCREREKGKTKYQYYNKEGEVLFLSDSSSKDSLLGIDKERLYDIFAYSEKLCKNIPFCRADFYIIGTQIIFGELTFTPCAGLDNDFTKEADIKLGELLDISGVQRTEMIVRSANK